MSSHPPSATSRWFLIGLAAYFVVQIASRVAVSPSAHLDESEQLVLTQALQWGYGPQPPLYTWLQWAVFTVTGPTVFGLSLLKNALLFTTCLLAFAIARRATGSVRGGMLGALALAFLPDLVWEAQRDLTHSVLATTLALAAIRAFLRLCENGRWINYLVFGSILGLGCLSKYNFAIAATALLVAALTLPETRRVLLNWRFAATLIVATVILAPHLLWAFNHPDLALASTRKFKIADDDASHLGAAASGLADALGLVAGVIGPALLVFGLALIRSRRGETSGAQPLVARLMARQFLIAALFVLLGIVAFRITDFRGRWFLPLLVGVPVLVSTAFWSRLTAKRVRVLMGVALVVLVAVTILLPARIIFAERLKRFEPLHQPYCKLAPQLRPCVGSNTVILAANKVIAGNLRLAGLRAAVVTPETWPVIPHPDADVLLVWDATRRPGLDEKFARAIEPLGLRAGALPQSVEAVCFYHASTTMRLASVRATSSRSPSAPDSN